MVGINGGKEVVLKTSKNLERLLEHSLSCFCYKADKIVVHDLNIKQDKTVLSLEEFNDLTQRVEANGQLSITHDDFSHYLETGDLPDYIKDH